MSAPDGVPALRGVYYTLKDECIVFIVLFFCKTTNAHQMFNYPSTICGKTYLGILKPEISLILLKYVHANF